MLQIQNYSNYILDNITLNIDKNLIILGHNGAGKSTLAKVLCGIIKSETLSINGEDFNTIAFNQRAKLINYIPTKLDIFDKYITMQEYLELSNIHSIDIKPIIEQLGIQHLLNKTKISSGEESLILIASALMHGAKFTIFDEPTANLDPKRTIKLYQLLKNDITIANKIIITHDINLANKLGYDILYISDGKIVFHGSNQAFFEEQNLESIFGEAIIKIEDFYGVNL
ncbi:MAG: ABC transporter ATP-binding protein [Campylobacterota bacterium]|nr:ABC transporter ATP-binding protein [Campylobacterota bacterium]